MTDAAASADTLAAVAALWDTFKDVNMHRLETVDEAAVAQLEGDLPLDLRRQAEREAHKLAGSVGTFGFAQGSVLAREIELILDGEKPLSQSQTLRLSQLAVALRHELESDPAPQKDASPHTHASGTRVLLVVDDDRDTTERVISEAVARGLHAQSAPSLSEARAIVGTHPPDIVLVDLDLPGGEDAALSLLSDLQSAPTPIPAVVYTTRDTFVDRVRVASLGGRGFLPKTLPPGEVLDTIVRVLETVRTRQCHVLSVDDDPTIGAALRALLPRHGMTVTTLDSPNRFWQTLDASPPDLLILDVDMPEIGGLALCRVVRNDPRWATVPVLFLTARADASTVSDVFAAGADDFVTKPFVGPELVARIRNRVERTQLLRRMTETDQLTGVSNRKTSSAALLKFLGLAERQGQRMSLAVVDIDHFKRINDRWGHATGDAILHQFASLLLQTFRGEDVIGRWGGEEFVIGMYGMNRGDAIQRMISLHNRLQAEPPRAPEGERVPITFCCGVASYPRAGRDLSTLYRAAEEALSSAKEQGDGTVLGNGEQEAAGPDVTTADVLVVDDDEVLGGVLMHALQTRGYRVQWLREGDTAAAMLTGPAPTIRTRLIMLDVDLPGLSGLGLLQRLTQEGVTRHTRVIMLTARAQETEVVKALDMGAFDHVAKPFSLPILMQRVRRALEVD